MGSTIAATLAPYVLALVGSLLLAAAAWIARKVSRWAWVQRALTEIGAAAWKVWGVFSASIKEKSSDGKLTAAEAKQAFDLAMATIKQNLGASGLASLAA